MISELLDSLELDVLAELLAALTALAVPALPLPHPASAIAISPVTHKRDSVLLNFIAFASLFLME
jgi:hypothetical protein